MNAAWHTLFLVPAHTPAQAAARAGLERLLVRAESALGHDPGPRQAKPSGWPAGRVNCGAGGRCPRSRSRRRRPRSWWASPSEARGPRRPAPGRPRGVRAVLARLAPGSPLLPIGARVAAGCVLAGWASMAVGVGHPYWAVVTAASIYQANTTLSWQRALQRTLGNLLGLLLYTALLPLMHARAARDDRAGAGLPARRGGLHHPQLLARLGVRHADGAAADRIRQSAAGEDADRRPLDRHRGGRGGGPGLLRAGHQPAGRRPYRGRPGAGRGRGVRRVRGCSRRGPRPGRTAPGSAGWARDRLAGMPGRAPRGRGGGGRRVVAAAPFRRSGSPTPSSKVTGRWPGSSGGSRRRSPTRAAA